MGKKILAKGASILALSTLLGGCDQLSDQISFVDPDLAPEQLAEMEEAEVRDESDQVPEPEPREYMGVTYPVTFTTANPTQILDTQNAGILNVIGEGLYRKKTDGSLVDGVATDQAQEVEPGVYQFTIKEEANWSNEEPIIAQDFVLAWQELVDPNNQNPYGNILNGLVENAQEIQAGQVEVKNLGVEAVDEKNLQVHLKDEVDLDHVKEVLAFPALYPLPSEQLKDQESLEEYGANSEEMYYNGPYVLSGWQSNWGDWSFIKNPYYWNADQYPTETILAQVVGSTQESLDSLDQNLVDMAYKTVNDSEKLTQTVYLQSNFYQAEEETNTPFSNPVLAKSLIGVIDNQEVAEEIGQDSQPASRLFPQEGGNQKQAQDQEENPETLNRYFQEELDRIDYDGLEMTLSVPATDIHQAAANSIKSQIENKLDNVVIKLLVDGNHRIQENIQDQSYDFTVKIGQTWDGQDAYQAYSQFTSRSPANKTGFSDPSYDQVLSDYNFGMSLDSQTIQEADQVLKDNLVIKPLVYIDTDFQTHSTVRSNGSEPVDHLVDMSPQFDFEMIEYLQNEESIPRIQEEVE